MLIACADGEAVRADIGEAIITWVVGDAMLRDAPDVLRGSGGAGLLHCTGESCRSDMLVSAEFGPEISARAVP